MINHPLGIDRGVTCPSSHGVGKGVGDLPPLSADLGIWGIDTTTIEEGIESALWDIDTQPSMGCGVPEDIKEADHKVLSGNVQMIDLPTELLWDPSTVLQILNSHDWVTGLILQPLFGRQQRHMISFSFLMMQSQTPESLACKKEKQFTAMSARYCGGLMMTPTPLIQTKTNGYFTLVNLVQGVHIKQSLSRAPRPTVASNYYVTPPIENASTTP